jgi:hypothetical protein
MTAVRSRVTFRLTARDPGNTSPPITFLCAVDKQTLRVCRATHTVRVKFGSHVLRVIAVDAQDNRSRTTTFRFKVTRKSPSAGRRAPRGARRPGTHPDSSRSGSPTAERAFSIALDDLASNIVPFSEGLLDREAPVLRAGAGYEKTWTRDAAINVWNGAGLLYPAEGRNTLLSVLERRNGEVVNMRPGVSLRHAVVALARRARRLDAATDIAAEGLRRRIPTLLARRPLASLRSFEQGRRPPLPPGREEAGRLRPAPLARESAEQFDDPLARGLPSSPRSSRITGRQPPNKHD